MRDFNMSRTELSSLIDDWIFSERNRDIIKRCWLDDLAYGEVAEMHGLSVRGVGKVIAQCKAQLQKHGLKQ